MFEIGKSIIDQGEEVFTVSGFVGGRLVLATITNKGRGRWIIQRDGTITRFRGSRRMVINHVREMLRS